MLRPDRMIRGAEVRRVIAGGEVIEDYPEDARGPSCLLLGYGDQDRPIHVVCAPRDDYLAIITAYLPDPQEWSGDFQIYLGAGLAILYSSPPTTMVFNWSDSPADAGPVSYAFD